MMLRILFLQTQQPFNIWADPNAVALIGIGVAIFFGIAGIIAAIWAAIYQVRKQRSQRVITCRIVSDAPVVDVNTAISGRVQVLLDGQPAKHARLIVLEVQNAGNVSVRTEDYFEPITFEFDKEVIGGDVLQTEPVDLIQPTNLKNFLIFGPKFVQLPTFPLNPGDAIRFTVLLKDESTLEKRGRIDQGKIEQILPTFAQGFKDGFLNRPRKFVK